MLQPRYNRVTGKRSCGLFFGACEVTFDNLLISKIANIRTLALEVLVSSCC